VGVLTPWDDELTDETIQLPVPYDLVKQHGEEIESGVLRMPLASDARPVLRLPLRLGDHDLGTWQAVDFAAEGRRGRPLTFMATLRRVEPR
jgi:hypothetical protein